METKLLAVVVAILLMQPYYLKSQIVLGTAFSASLIILMLQQVCFTNNVLIGFNKNKISSYGHIIVCHIIVHHVATLLCFNRLPQWLYDLRPLHLTIPKHFKNGYQ